MSGSRWHEWPSDAASGRLRTQLLHVTAHIHDHLAEPLDLNRLAAVADLLPFHWHRIWHALMGETVAATARRQRLHQALAHLAQIALTVTDIAGRCGHPNAQSFTRAFRQFFGQSPQTWRATRTDARPWRTAATAQSVGWPVTARKVPGIELADRLTGIYLPLADKGAGPA